MTEEELDKWWGHLAIAKKEELAKEPYPECSAWWCDKSKAQQEAIYHKAGGNDAHDHSKWKKGNGSFT